MRACWHPVAWAAEVGAEPVAADLLEERLVLWRDTGGAVNALSDLCIHRGTALSLGRVEGDEIVCPYHAWRYDTGGVCTAIPQLADPTRVPAKARVAKFRAQERYGLVWVALEEPRWPLPEVPELDSGELAARAVRAVPLAGGRVEAGRELHRLRPLPVGAPGPARRPVAAGRPRPHGPHRGPRPALRDRPPGGALDDDFPVFANEERETPQRRSRYELHLPYTIVLRLGWGGHEGMVYFFASQPLAPERCAGWVVIGRNYNLEQPDSVLQDFEDVIFGQDQRIVESQRPEIVPFDLADELHLRFDAVAVAYRRAMRDQGLAA